MEEEQFRICDISINDEEEKIYISNKYGEE
jgi:hypothetical protein